MLGQLTLCVAATALLALAAAPLHATDYPAGELLIAQPWSPPTPPTAAVGAVYLSITNRGATADRLVAVSTPVAGSAEIHESRTLNGMVTMDQLPALDCPAHATVTIAPGGLHIMLLGLKRPLAAGADFPLTLRFEGAGAVTVQVHVAARG